MYVLCEEAALKYWILLEIEENPVLTYQGV